MTFDFALGIWIALAILAVVAAAFLAAVFTPTYTFHNPGELTARRRAEKRRRA